MPTLKPRYMITETDEVSRAIDLLAISHPEVRNERSKLLRLIIDKGISALEIEANNSAKAAAIKELAGSMPDIWPTNWRDELQAEWPE